MAQTTVALSLCFGRRFTGILHYAWYKKKVLRLFLLHPGISRFHGGLSSRGARVLLDVL